VQESLTITQKGIMPRVQPDGGRPLLYPCVGKWPTIFLVYTVILSLVATTGARAKVDPKACARGTSLPALVGMSRGRWPWTLRRP
jgi:hypothetical protein